MRFEKESLDEWKRALQSLPEEFSEEAATAIYNNIKLPQRATKGSAGYDFYNPFRVLNNRYCADDWMLVPTGIRWIGDDDKVLVITPRSGFGFKYNMRLINTVGIIDSDYANATNEGHIMVKYTSAPFKIEQGQAFVQGIILPYFKVDEDNVTETRTGGFGSTTK